MFEIFEFIQLVMKKMGFYFCKYNKNYLYMPKIHCPNYEKLIDITEIDEFYKHARIVVENKKTTLDYKRLYIIYQVIKIVKDIAINGNNNFCEMGVFKGGSTYFISSVANQIIKPPPNIFCFDTFEGHPDDITPILDGEHRKGQFNKTSFGEVKNYLSIFTNVSVLKGRFQNNFEDINKKLFSFVHLDVDIYSATKDALHLFENKIVKNGIILTDDYGFTTCKGVKKAVDEFTNNNKNYIKLDVLTGQCILMKIN